MPILILSRTRPSLHWERISVSHSSATAASPTAAKEPDKYRRLIGAMSAHGPSRHFAATQYFGRFRREADIDGRAALTSTDAIGPKADLGYLGRCPLIACARAPVV